LTWANIPQLAFIGKVSPHLQANLAPSWDYKEGSGCAFFCHKTRRYSGLPSLHIVQLFTDAISGLLHHLETGPVALSKSGLWHWHYAIGIASCRMALEFSQPNSCLSNSKANNTRVETPGRPQWACLGNRWASWRSMVATEAAQGNVSTYVHLKGGLHARQVKSI
jgi:hypothetical protein